MVTTTLDGSALWLRLDRPDALGAINFEVIASLQAGFDRAESNPDVRVVVLAGSGRAFCAGADLKAVNEGVIFRFLTKPWDADDLRGQLRDAFAQRQLVQDNQRLREQLMALER